MSDKLSVDFDWFHRTFPDWYRKEVGEAVSSIVRQTAGMNHEYFLNMSHYTRRNILPDGRAFNDIFPPNIAMLDYCHRFLVPEEIVLDYCCGICVPALYLSKLGFTVVGLDNWTQIPREVAERFLNRMETTPKVLLPPAPPSAHTVVVNISMWLENPEVVTDRVHTIIADSWYRQKEKYAGNLPGFELVAEYPGLIDVFKRK